MIYILTKKSNGEAVLRKKFRTIEYAERWLNEQYPDWEKQYNLEIIAY